MRRSGRIKDRLEAGGFVDDRSEHLADGILSFS